MEVSLNINIVKKDGYYRVYNSYHDFRLRSLVQLNYYKRMLSYHFNRTLNYALSCYGSCFSRLSLISVDSWDYRKIQDFSFAVDFQLKNLLFHLSADYQLQLIYLEKLLLSVSSFSSFVGLEQMTVNLDNLYYNLYYEPVSKPVLSICPKNVTLYSRLSFCLIS